MIPLFCLTKRSIIIDEIIIFPYALNIKRKEGYL